MFFSAFAVPMLPVQIYGSLNKDVADGTQISIKINDVTYATSTIKDNKFGYDPVILIDSDDSSTQEKEGYTSGDNIEIYIGSVKVHETTSIDTAISVDISDSELSQVSTTKTSSSNSGSSKGSSKSSSSSSSSKPIEEQPTQITQDIVPEQTTTNNQETIQEDVQPVRKESTISITGIILAIIGILIILGIVGFIVLKVMKPKQDLTTKMNDYPELRQYILNMKMHGYDDAHIRQTLINGGWDQETINRFL